MIVALGWAAAALLLGLGIGRAVRIADRREHAPHGRPLVTVTTSSTSAGAR